MSNPVLDIIVTHYDETWDECRPFFDMLMHQKNADMSQVQITLVHGNPDNHTMLDNNLRFYYPFANSIKTLVSEGNGLAEARNLGLENTSAPWVMFCNIDDMFADVCSLSMYLENIPTEEYDVIWSKIVREQKISSAKEILSKTDNPYMTSVAGKMYRRKMLEENRITFFEHDGLEYFCDYMFNAVVLSCVEPFRIAAMTTDFYPYFKTYRYGSARHNLPAYRDAAKAWWKADVSLFMELLQRGHNFNAYKHAMKAVFRKYYGIDESVAGDTDGPFASDTEDMEFVSFYQENIDTIRGVISDADADPIREEIEAETVNLVQQIYTEHGAEYYFRNESMSFEEWSDMISDCQDSAPETQPTYTDRQSDDARAVVYCGTRNVYLDMVSSLKSLLFNTAIDKVYFLIEDDVFPYELPDMVECINVSNQTFFPKDGPNYNNPWTYMVMIRAIFPLLFEQHRRILSLDIDVVVDDDISDLWDIDLSGYYLAGVPEPQRMKLPGDPLYINFGVALLNLDKLRRDNKVPKIINLLNTSHLDCAEQTSYNKVCAGKILPLPAEYNYTAYSHITGDTDRKRIIHFAGHKFWRHYNSVRKYSKLSWDEVMQKQNMLKEGQP